MRKITYKEVLAWLGMTLAMGAMVMAIIVLANVSFVEFVVKPNIPLTVEQSTEPWSHLFTEVESTTDVFLTDDKYMPVKIYRGPRDHHWLQSGHPPYRLDMTRLCTDTDETCTSKAFEEDKL